MIKLASMETLQEVAKEGAADEYTDHLVYKRLAESGRTKDPKLRGILTKLSDAEYKHYEFWRKYSPETKVRPSMSTSLSDSLPAVHFWSNFCYQILGETRRRRRQEVQIC